MKCEVSTCPRRKYLSVRTDDGRFHPLCRKHYDSWRRWKEGASQQGEGRPLRLSVTRAYRRLREDRNESAGAGGEIYLSRQRESIYPSERLQGDRRYEGWMR